MTHIEKKHWLTTDYFLHHFKKGDLFWIITITAYYLESIAEYITLNLAFKYSYNCDTTSYLA